MHTLRVGEACTIALLCLICQFLMPSSRTGLTGIFEMVQLTRRTFNPLYLGQSRVGFLVDNKGKNVLHMYSIMQTTSYGKHVYFFYLGGHVNCYIVDMTSATRCIYENLACAKFAFLEESTPPCIR